MANRDNHYEAAFEEYLRSRGVPYVAVDEAKRSVLSDGGSIKSLDFIVSTPGQVTWLVDVKGRRFPSGDIQKQYWKNWSTRDDLRQPGPMGAALRPGFLRAVRLRLQHPGRPGAAALRAAFRVPRQALRLRGRAADATTPAMPGRSRPSGTRWPCRPPISAASPGRWTNCSESRKGKGARMKHK